MLATNHLTAAHEVSPVTTAASPLLICSPIRIHHGFFFPPAYDRPVFVSQPAFNFSRRQDRPYLRSYHPLPNQRPRRKPTNFPHRPPYIPQKMGVDGKKNDEDRLLSDSPFTLVCRRDAGWNVSRHLVNRRVALIVISVKLIRRGVMHNDI